MTAVRGAHRSLSLAVLGGTALALLVSAVALAHPLGNFTINHYAGVRVSTEGVVLDVVIDMAEIPTFQERRKVDADGDGEVSDAEVEAARIGRCETLAPDLELAVDGGRAGLDLLAAGLSFPMGNGGLPTMRLVCTFETAFSAPLAAPTSITFGDRSYAARLGWREIVVEGDAVTLASAAGELARASVSRRLTAYPEDRLAQPLDARSVTFTATPGGQALAPFEPLDAVLLAPIAAPSASAEAALTPLTSAAAVPGGVGEGELPDVFGAAELSPAIVALALLTAVALGAGHALTPGHGKTLMAAYLVGTRGTALHAAVLGLSVSVSHTFGILVLALLVGGAQTVLPPDVLVRVLPVVAAVTIVGIGGWMLVSEIRRRLATSRLARAHDAAHAGGVDHVHGHGEAHEALEHSHGGIRHSHAQPPASTITWRSLFVLGLAGGLVPSTNALLILLGTIAAGRPAYGVVLVVAFGLGMALVMGGIGLAIVFAGDRVRGLSSGGSLSRFQAQVPIGAAAVVLGIGLWLTTQALVPVTGF